MPSSLFFLCFHWDSVKPFLLYLTCKILVPQPEAELRALAAKVLSPNHWTVREFPPPFLIWASLLSAASEGTISQDNSQSWLPTPTSKPHCWQTGVTKSCDLQENTGFVNCTCRDTPNRSECFFAPKDVQECWQRLSSRESKIGRHLNVHQ